jgi:hypothetical protein
VNASASPVMIAYDGSDAAKHAISAAAEAANRVRGAT